MEPLKIAAYCGYLASWLTVIAVGLSGLVSRRHRQASEQVHLTIPTIIGTGLQIAAALVLTWSMPDTALNPSAAQLAGVLILAPLGAAIFAWAMWSVPKDAQGGQLVTGGCYRWLRHPMYLAFLALLGATGLLVAPWTLQTAALLIYLIGTELRIADEEAALRESLGEAYPAYCARTRWRYLPGLR